MYKKLLALCLAALLTASAAGCSQGTEGSSAPAEGGSAPAGDAAPSGEVVTIRMGGWGNFEDEHAPGTVGMEEAIGVKIEFQKYPTDHVYPEVLRAGNRHIRHQELNPGPGTGFPALQY